MSISDPIPLKFELSSVADDSQYHIHSRTEILSILRRLLERNEQAALYYDEGNHAILTLVLEVRASQDQLVLDCSANEPSNRHVELSNKLVFISSLDNVKIQFVIPHIQRIEFEGKCAFVVTLPSSLLRLQRREYYRLTTPNLKPLTCTIPMPGREHTEVSIINISAGGVAIIGYKGELNLLLNEVYHNCVITLPDVGAVHVNIQVKATFDITMKNNVVKKRAGCKFVDMAGHTQTLIQRYIMKLELDRKASLKS
ncbi:MAG: flagellar brake protein [Burkholderiales bacterium]|nr:flagellar brake protein [Burkholderiales bacterium]